MAITKEQEIKILKAELKEKEVVVKDLQKLVSHKDAIISNQHVEISHMKRTFELTRANYDREKNRLDKVIDTALNNSKPIVVTRNDNNNNDCMRSK